MVVPFSLAFAHVEAKMLSKVIQTGEFLSAHFTGKHILGKFPAAGMIKMPLKMILPGEILTTFQTGERLALAVCGHMIVENFSRRALGIALAAAEFVR